MELHWVEFRKLFNECSRENVDCGGGKLTGEAIRTDKKVEEEVSLALEFFWSDISRDR